jgi:quercetin dioxygenase-like cupin family protein
MTVAHVSRQGAGQHIAWIGGTSHTIVVDGRLTDGRLTVLRSRFVGGTGAPVHVHPEEDENLVFLYGSATVWVGNQRLTVSAGDTVFLPRRIPHTYNISSAVAEIITVCTPSGMERFFQDAGWDLAQGQVPQDWTVDVAALQNAASRSGQIILGPPLEGTDTMPARLTTWSADNQ